MKQGVVCKLTRVATLSLLVLTTTAGVASWEVIAASPAMAADDPGSGSAPAPAPAPGSPTTPDNPVTKLLSNITGGGGNGGGETPAP